MNFRSFLPWIAFGAIASASWQWAAVVAFAIGLRALVSQRRAGVPADALILEISTCAHFAVLAAIAFKFPHSPLKHYDGAFSLAWLAATVWITLAVHRPFTLGIARRQAPQEVWNAPHFIRLNVVLTTVWAVAFTATAAATAACDAANTPTFAAIACEVVGFAIPAVFTSRYPKIVMNRLAAADAR